MLRDRVPDDPQQRRLEPRELLRLPSEGEHDADASDGRVQRGRRDRLLGKEHDLWGYFRLRRNRDRRRVWDCCGHLLLLGLLRSELRPGAWGWQWLQRLLLVGICVELTHPLVAPSADPRDRARYAGWRRPRWRRQCPRRGCRDGERVLQRGGRRPLRATSAVLRFARRRQRSRDMSFPSQRPVRTSNCRGPCGLRSGRRLGVRRLLPEPDGKLERAKLRDRSCSHIERCPGPSRWITFDKLARGHVDECHVGHPAETSQPISPSIAAGTPFAIALGPCTLIANPHHPSSLSRNAPA
jgi:hypothetical protein